LIWQESRLVDRRSAAVHSSISSSFASGAGSRRGARPRQRLRKRIAAGQQQYGQRRSKPAEHHILLAYLADDHIGGEHEEQETNASDHIVPHRKRDV